MNTAPQERNQEATVYVGGLDEKVTEELLSELFLQAGPVVNVHMPKDRVTGLNQGYGFVEFLSEQDAEYAVKIMQMIKLYSKPIRVNKATSNVKSLDVGANIYIGNLAPEVDEKLLYDTFSAFGVILQHPKIMRDPHTGATKGFAFINYAAFESSDAAIHAMNGQFLCNRAISVTYAFKKDGQGERHGSASERLLAAQRPLIKEAMPHQLFADSARDQTLPAIPPPIPSAQMPLAGPPPGLAPHLRLPPNMHPSGIPPMHPSGIPPAGPPPHFPPPPLPHAHQFAPPPSGPSGFPPQNFAPPGFQGGLPPPAHGPPGFPGQAPMPMGQPPMPQGPPPSMGQPPMPPSRPPMGQPPMPQGLPPPMPQGLPPPMPQGPPPSSMGQPPMPPGQPPRPLGPPPQAMDSIAISGEEAYLRRMRLSQQQPQF